MEWLPITRGEPEVRGEHPEWSGVLDVRIQLSHLPPPEWTPFFLAGVDVIMRGNMRIPEVDGREVTIYPTSQEIRDYVQNVTDRIDSANKLYEQQILPKARAREEQRRLEAAEKERRLAEAREQVKKL